jgi:hypothetical protein
MSDVNTFIDTIGKDVNETIVPKVQALAEQVSTRTFTTYGPRVSAFANQLVKDIIDEQSATVRDFVTAAIEDLFQRYRPEITGELHAKMVPGAVELTGRGVALELKRRDSGAVVASLDVPISLRIKVDDLAVRLQNTTIKLNVVK